MFSFKKCWTLLKTHKQLIINLNVVYGLRKVVASSQSTIRKLDRYEVLDTIFFFKGRYITFLRNTLKINYIYMYLPTFSQFSTSSHGHGHGFQISITLIFDSEGLWSDYQKVVAFILISPENIVTDSYYFISAKVGSQRMRHPWNRVSNKKIPYWGTHSTYLESNSNYH